MLRHQSWCSRDYDGPAEAKSVRDSWYWSKRAEGLRVKRWIIDNQTRDNKYAIIYGLSESYVAAD